MQCIDTQAEFHCSQCDTDQHKSNFEVAMRSLTAGIVCKKCQAGAGGRKWGWFTCRAQGCGLRLPKQASGNPSGKLQYCQNCSHNKQRGQQTCRRCGAKIDGGQGETASSRCIIPINTTSSAPSVALSSPSGNRFVDD
eukprot:2673695-Amphidinium_carterae.1